MPEEFWLQVEAAHLSGKQPAFIQAAAAENLIQMTSSFLPSDLSGILFYSTPPPSPCSSPSQSLCSSLNAHPAILSLSIFLSPCLPFHHTTSCPPTPHSLRLLSLLPRALFRGRLNTTSRSSDSSSATQKLCWVAPRYRCCDCTHLAATLFTSHPKTNGSLATATGDCKHSQSIGITVALLVAVNETGFYFAFIRWLDTDGNIGRLLKYMQAQT